MRRTATRAGRLVTLSLCLLAAACGEPQLDTPPPPPDPEERRPEATLSLGERTTLEQDCTIDPARAGLPCGAVLGGRAAAALLAGCGAGSAVAPPTFWTPDAAVLARLEDDLALALRLMLGRKEISQGRLHPEDFRRQYVGVFVDDRRMIHVSGFHRSRLAVAAIEQPRLLNWRTEAVLNCDNEPGFFQADYDVSRGRLTNMRLSGPDAAN